VCGIGKDARQGQEVQSNNENGGGNDPVRKTDVRQDIAHNQDQNRLRSIDDVEEASGLLLGGRFGFCASAGLAKGRKLVSECK
jgi:hypothetical protein